MALAPTFDTTMAVRTAYGDDASFDTLRTAALAPSEEGFEAELEVVEDPELADLSTEDVLHRLSPEYNRSFVLVIDHRTLSEDDHPILVVDLRDEPGNARGRQFRVVPGELWSVENNLSEHNMDFDEFADVADASDGVFRGF